MILDLIGRNLLIEISLVEQTKIVDLFWFLLFLGNFIAVWIFGRLADRFGRKELAILGVYMVSLALLGFSISLSPLTLLITALAIGIGISGLETTLNTSMFIDLSPRNAFGRYTAIGLTSLVAGLSIGRYIGYEIIAQFSNDIASITLLSYLMLFVTSLAVYPLTQMDDTHPPLDFLVLLVRAEGGGLIYSNNFQNEFFQDVELALVSSGLEAIDIFMREILRREKLGLEHVLHAGHYILNESDQEELIHVNLVTNHRSPELRYLVKRFAIRFSEKYQEVLSDWHGRVDTFSDADELVEEIFGPLIPSTDLI